MQSRIRIEAGHTCVLESDPYGKGLIRIAEENCAASDFV